MHGGVLHNKAWRKAWRQLVMSSQLLSACLAQCDGLCGLELWQVCLIHDHTLLLRLVWLCSELQPDSLEDVVRHLAPTHPEFDGQAVRQMLGLA